jgi:hypothetical protein
MINDYVFCVLNMKNVLHFTSVRKYLLQQARERGTAVNFTRRSISAAAAQYHRKLEREIVLSTPDRTRRSGLRPVRYIPT